MMARNATVPLTGRIQKRKTDHLRIVIFGLQRAAGPYRWATSRNYPTVFVSRRHPVAAQRNVEMPSGTASRFWLVKTKELADLILGSLAGTCDTTSSDVVFWHNRARRDR